MKNLNGSCVATAIMPELGLWATVDRQPASCLGRCGLLPWHINGTDEVELAFMIKQERWRRVLATEAALRHHPSRRPRSSFYVA